MKAPVLIAISAAACLGLAILCGGAAPFGRLALAVGLTGPARMLLRDPAWLGTAQARAGQYDKAADDFARAPGADYNTGVTLARAGRYAAALEAFDRAIAADPSYGCKRESGRTDHTAPYILGRPPARRL